MAGADFWSAQSGKRLLQPAVRTSPPHPRRTGSGQETYRNPLNGDIFRLDPIAVKEDASFTETDVFYFVQHFIAINAYQ